MVVIPTPLSEDLGKAAWMILGAFTLYHLVRGLKMKARGRNVEAHAWWCNRLSILSLLCGCFLPLITFFYWYFAIALGWYAKGAAQNMVTALWGSEALFTFAVFCGISMTGFIGNTILAIPGSISQSSPPLEPDADCFLHRHANKMKYIIPVLLIVVTLLVQFYDNFRLQQFSHSFHSRGSRHDPSPAESNQLISVARDAGFTNEIDYLLLMTNSNDRGNATLIVVEKELSPTNSQVQPSHSYYVENRLGSWVKERYLVPHVIIERNTSLYIYGRPVTMFILAAAILILFIRGNGSAVGSRSRELYSWLCRKTACLAVFIGVLITTMDLANFLEFYALLNLPDESFRSSIRNDNICELSCGLTVYIGLSIAALVAELFLAKPVRRPKLTSSKPPEDIC